MHDIDLMLKLQLEGKHNEARAISDKLEELGPDRILDVKGNNTQDIWFRHCFNRGWFLLQDGDYQAGCKILEHGRFLNVYGNLPLKTAAPLYNPEQCSIKDKSIIISLEGGLGDEIIHARFAQSFKAQGASKVYLAAAPELQSVFSRIPGVDGVILRNQAHMVQHDYWIPGFSAGWVAGHTFDNLPNTQYMIPKPDSVEVWKSLINSDRIKVGIRWAGNPKFEHQQFRRFPEKFLTNLSKYSKLQIYSLQRDNNIVDLPEGVVDLQHLLLSWEDTMAAIQNLDIVITSCTSIAHMSAAMGKETWVIVPILPYHTWTYQCPTSTSSPYYSSVKLFRQKQANSWNQTFQQLYSSLEDRFGLTHLEMPNEDAESKKLNLGCGLKKFDGFLNVDSNSYVKPDQVVDLNQLPWPWKDNEFSHIVAKDILEHLGTSNEHFLKILEEMYRVTQNGGIWEVQVPHPRSDTALDDPTHQRIITKGTFDLLNKRRMLELANLGESDSLLAFSYNIDLEVCDYNYEYTPVWEEKIRSGISQEEIESAVSSLNNVAYSTRLLIQVHKPSRASIEEIRIV